MRWRWLSGVVAATLAIVVAAPPRPAQAGLDDWFEDIGNALAEIVANSDQGGGPDPQLEAAKQEIIAAVNAAKQEILDHIDAIANADVRACTDAGVIQVAQVDALDPITLALFVDGAVRCATLSSAYFDAVQDIRAADNIGFLMSVIYSIAMVGFTKFNLSTVDLVSSLIVSYEHVVTRLTPANCVKKVVPEPRQPGEPPAPVEKWWECTAYNGDVGQSGSCFGRGCEPDRAAAENDATRNTSRAIAVKALPQLRAALANA